MRLRLAQPSEQVPIDAVRWVNEARHTIEARTGAQISQHPDQPCIFRVFGDDDAVDEARQEIRRTVSEAVDTSQTSRAESRQDDYTANFAGLSAMNESINFLRNTVNAPSEYCGSECGKEEPVEFKTPLAPSTFGAAAQRGFKVPEVPTKPNGRHGLRVGDETLRYVPGTTMTVKQYACTKCSQRFWASYNKNGKNKYRLLEDPTRHRCGRPPTSLSHRAAPYDRQRPVVKQEMDDFESYSRSSSVTSSVLFGSQKPKQERDDFSRFSRASSAASSRKVKCTLPDGTIFELDDPQDYVQFRKAYDQVKNEE